MYRIRTPNGLHLAKNDPSQNTTHRAQRGDGGKYMVSVAKVLMSPHFARTSSVNVVANSHLHALFSGRGTKYPELVSDISVLGGRQAQNFLLGSN